MNSVRVPSLAVDNKEQAILCIYMLFMYGYEHIIPIDLRISLSLGTPYRKVHVPSDTLSTWKWFPTPDFCSVHVPSDTLGTWKWSPTPPKYYPNIDKYLPNLVSFRNKPTFLKKGMSFQQKKTCGHLFSRKHSLG